MSYSDHSFDWKGFAYAASALAVFLVIASIGQYLYPSVYPRLAANKAVEPAPIPRALDVLDQRASIASSTNSLAQYLSSTTPQRVINALTIADVVPAEGKLIAADLQAMKLYTYLNGSSTAEYTIRSKGKSGTPWETPAGFYTIQTREEDHFSTVGKVHMPYSMQFYGNYFIHGWPYYPGGVPVASTFSGGCIRLSTKDAAEVYAFAEQGTGLFVYDPKNQAASTTPAIPLSLGPVPTIASKAFIVADMDSGDVYLEHNASTTAMAASVTNMVTAIVANESISFDKQLTLPEGDLLHPADPKNESPKKFFIGDALYPLLMESKDIVAKNIAEYHGEEQFVNSMNRIARALDMQSTHFTTVDDAAAANTSTTDDVFRLAVYLANKKSFVWNILRSTEKKLTAVDGSTYAFYNANALAGIKTFAGSSVGMGTTTLHTEVASTSEGQASTTVVLSTESPKPTRNSVVSQFLIPMKDKTHRVAIIVLESDNYVEDTQKLLNWFTVSAQQGGAMAGTACSTCAKVKKYRRIEL